MVSSTVLIMVNVDDVTGETVPYLFETLMNMGAMNVHAIPAFTKKGRQELIFLIDTPREKITEIGDFLVGELGTLGLRVFEESEHIEFDYQVKESRLIVQDEATGEVYTCSVAPRANRRSATCDIEGLPVGGSLRVEAISGNQAGSSPVSRPITVAR